MRLRHLPLALALLTPAFAATPGPSADTVLTAAKSTAAADHKNILLTFSASWCGPCRMFEAFLRDPAIAPIMDKAFVIASLDVGEKPTDARHADSPGAVDLRARLGGGEAGYPFIVMLDSNGAPLANSLRPTRPGKPGDNIGYPASSDEIKWFMHMLANADPSLTPQDAKTIDHWLKAHSPA